MTQLLDSTKNFSKVTVSTGYNSTDTTIVLSTGQGARLPSPEYNLVWWDFTDYNDPSDDPNVEIVRVTTLSTDTLTIQRAQEGTVATNKNLSGKTYKMILAPTEKMITDINSYLLRFSSAEVPSGTVD